MSDSYGNYGSDDGGYGSAYDDYDLPDDAVVTGWAGGIDESENKESSSSTGTYGTTSTASTEAFKNIDDDYKKVDSTGVGSKKEAVPKHTATKRSKKGWTDRAMGKAAVYAGVTLNSARKTNTNLRTVLRNPMDYGIPAKQKDIKGRVMIVGAEHDKQMQAHHAKDLKDAADQRFAETGRQHQIVQVPVFHQHDEFGVAVRMNSAANSDNPEAMGNYMESLSKEDSERGYLWYGAHPKHMEAGRREELDGFLRGHGPGSSGSASENVD